ncbi:C40 family peptidase [Ferruginibacter lapsinanis]|uniref:C40 family peptidase n=1 Tax=Ferruginibacter lapsinanis TaxID=563172 RepID=UPI001E518C70|nr:C40 family peptidase [Ferruginibacter lapsinanis]UEG51202.1 C40 family peptidase [Ferruginibacter lapsinanis]
MDRIFLITVILLVFNCCTYFQPDNVAIAIPDTIQQTISVGDSVIVVKSEQLVRDSFIQPFINVKNINADSVIHFAKTLLGVPYKYASTDPTVGFDCSGFITYVFNHFNIAVPRSSVDFTNVGTAILLKDAVPGDLILFTGTDSLIRIVGHMGIITENSDTLKFIHSSSGKANGVVITPLNKYYKTRFVKTIRL